MKIICAIPPGRTVEADVLRALGDTVRIHGLDPEFYDMADDFSYGRLLMDCWKTGESFFVNEPDVVVPADRLEEILLCDHDYCAFVYPWTTQIGPALGATCFGAPLLASVPVPELHATHYRQVDYKLMRVILGRQHGRQPHLHLPPVRHLNPSQELREEFRHLTLGEHLAALGYAISADGKTADYVRETAEFGEPRTVRT